MTDYKFNNYGCFSWSEMLPGEKFAVWTTVTIHDSELVHKYVFEKEPKAMRLIIDESILPDDLPEYMKANRDIQEVLEGRDIDSANMAIYLYPGVPNVVQRKQMELFAREPDDQRLLGEKYTTKSYVFKIEAVMAEQAA